MKPANDSLANRGTGRKNNEPEASHSFRLVPLDTHQKDSQRCLQWLGQELEWPGARNFS